MKIDKNNGVNFPEDNGKKKDINNKQKPSEQKQAEASALDAMSNQGRAMVNVSFKGHSQTSEKEMSDKDFESLRNYLGAKRRSLTPEMNKLIMSEENYTRENIKLVEKILMNKSFNNNPAVMKHANEVIKSADTPEKAQVKCNLLDKALEQGIIPKQHLINSKEIKNEIINKNNEVEHFMNYVLNCNTKEQFELTNELLFLEKGKSKSIDWLLAPYAPLLIGHINTHKQLKLANKIISDIKTPEQFKIAQKILSDEKLYGNENVVMFSKDIISETKTAEEAQAKCDIIDKILSNERLYGNEHIMDIAGSIIYKTNTAEKAQAKCEIIDKILSDERLFGNENIIKSLVNIINKTETQEQSQAKCAIIDKILSDERLYNNEIVMSWASPIIEETNTLEQTQAKSNIIDKFLSDERLYGNKSIINQAGSIIRETDTPEEAQAKCDIIDKLLSDERLYGNNKIMDFICTHPYGIVVNTRTLEAAQAKCQIIDKILSDERLFGNENIIDRLDGILEQAETAQAKCDIIDKILSDERLFGNQNVMNHIWYLITKTNTPEQIQIANKILSDERLFGNEDVMNHAGGIIDEIYNPEKFQLANKILSNEKIYGNKKIFNTAVSILYKTKFSTQFQIADKIFSDERLFGNEKFLSGSSVMFPENDYNFIPIKPEEVQISCNIIDKILFDERLYGNENFMNNAWNLINATRTPEQVQIADKILSDEKLFGNKIVMHFSWSIIHETRTPEQVQIADKILSDEKLYGNENFMNNAWNIISATKTPEQVQIADKILSDEKLYGNEKFMDNARYIIEGTNDPEEVQAKCDIIDKIFSDERLYNNIEFMKEIHNVLSNIKTIEDGDNLLKVLEDKEIPINQALFIFLDKENEISYRQLQKLNKIMGRDKTSKLSKKDTITAVKFIDVYKKQNINEIPIQAKREFLRNLVSANADLFNISDELKQYFPMLPKNQEEYCSLLPSLVRSLGIETNTLNDNQVKEFNNDLNALSLTVSSMSDEDFNNLDIKQEYDKNTFIKDVLSVVKDMPSKERQKVYDYFGFELHHNNSQTGFSITGYPVNLNNGKKLAQITNPETKKNVEQLRPYVIKFSQNNHVICNDKEIEAELNKIVNVLPELRTQIGKIQHKTHNFDVFKHSLKVMQKVVQNPEYNKLNDSDKKLMLLASLLHDIAKLEGSTDKKDYSHAFEGCFDSYYIAKKFNLSRDEEIKLNELIKHHEWLNFVNTSKNEQELDKRLKDTAYDLRHDNMLDMALIFTHADLKAVKKDNSFHDTTEGSGRRVIDGKLRSFGESADIYADKIRNLIEQLKPSQPLLPVTPIPKASTIEKAITVVNDDGSTNIKGIYKDKDGLIVIKFNELENKDLETIGFPAGSIVKGIKSTTQKDEDVDTGNIKFFAHGLNYPNQLTKFDAFPLPDSDALLSVSYAERPESKYRFFRPQGILLDCDTKYIHGGGNTDKGSGCGKKIQEFKDNYIFGGHRKADRTYISDLIKEATGMNDKEYIEFVKENENKSLSEIEPAKVRTKIINAFATINSNIRNGKREYNEMYISNPKPPMAVFAYEIDIDKKINNPLDFLAKETRTAIECKLLNNWSLPIQAVKGRIAFLREYALERDIPFVVFGD